MDLDVLLDIIDGKIINKKTKKQKIKEIKIDSREIKKGDCFIALKGENIDSHQYVKDALEKEPSCIIVCEKIDVKTKVPIVIVEDTYQTLMKIGTFFRNKYDIPVIAITGSVGKTTTKELIAAILSQKYQVLKSPKNYNNHIGLPLTLFNLNHNYDICVLELGMNHLGEISNLSKMCRPHIGVITNIGTAHIGNLGSKKNIFKAKMEIKDGMTDGLLIVNDKDKFLKKVKYSRLIKVGTNLKPYQVIVSDKTYFKLVINNKVYRFSYNSCNKTLLTNFLLAIQVGLLFKIDIEDIKKTISNYQMPKERMNIYVNNTTKIIDDCYNASLESVKASIDVLKKETNKKVLILGDILELGDYSSKIHKKIGREIRKLKNTTILLIGTEVKNIKGNQYHYFDNNEQLKQYLGELNLDNTTVLVKASRKMHLEDIINYLKVS